MAGVIVGIDLGSSYTKVHVVDGRGECVWTGKVRAPVQFGGAAATQDMDRTMADVVRLIQQSGAAHRPVSAIIATGQMGGYVPVGPDGTLLAPLDSYLDTRFEPFAQPLMAAGGERVWRLSGGNPFVGPKVGRAAAMGDLPPGTAAVVNAAAVPAILLCRLPAEAAFTDTTQVWLWGLYDARQAQWDAELLDLFHVSGELLPQVVEPWSRVGGLDHSWASRLGLKSGTPVFAGAGDGMVGWFGLGAGAPGTAVDTAGTTSHLGIALSAFHPDVTRRVACMRGVGPQEWFHQGWASGAGLAYEWCLANLVPGSDGTDVPLGSDGVRLLPYFAGRTSPDQPSQRGSILGLRPHHHRGHLIRAFLEAIAFEFAEWAAASEACGGGVHTPGIVAVGSGAQNDLWLQIKADVLGVSFLRAPDRDYAARGLATIARYGLGDAALACPPPDLDDCRWFEPNDTHHQMYQAVRQDYLTLADQVNTYVCARGGTHGD